MHASTYRRFGKPPGADDILAIAAATLRSLPREISAHLADILLEVEELADGETLAELDLEDPFDLTGIYQGVAVTAKSVSDPAPPPDRIILYRRAILDEWAAGDETLERLVHHIVIHEIGHHFGLSDADMHRLEQEQQ